MRIKFLSVALGLALTATVMSASAQKKYTEGVVNFTTAMMGQQINAKSYFRADSNAFAFSNGPANIKILTDAGAKSMVILVDVPVANIKKAAVATPDDIDQAMAGLPQFTFAPGTETKVINGFNCKKVVATDKKTSKTYDIWITNDIEIPLAGVAKYYQGIGGFPVQYTSFSQGQSTEVTVTGVTEQKVPAGTFGIPADFEKITLDDLKAMRGGR
ncbi:hypothetical protein [Mucilaginibacter ginsenosidivorax]|uniref:DUF4412 domain-containing protein n=1 Tax=Mucilaginibacter ginsenosidivorax TaxID=862126 RepID=A0A5B8W647_9SPHI|nr:hypothetical protein [Mucilaginibacter ginsenosidivorax]QEC78395.1 hypothetical protein FSB76_21515 [Mucilaginibacter ginsenosidivorax]